MSFIKGQLTIVDGVQSPLAAKEQSNAPSVITRTRLTPEAIATSIADKLPEGIVKSPENFAPLDYTVNGYENPIEPELGSWNIPAAAQLIDEISSAARGFVRPEIKRVYVVFG